MALPAEQAVLLELPPPLPLDRPEHTQVQAHMAECRPDLWSADCAQAASALATDLISGYDEQQARCTQTDRQILLSQRRLRRAFDVNGLERDDAQALMEDIRQGQTQSPPTAGKRCQRRFEHREESQQAARPGNMEVGEAPDANSFTFRHLKPPKHLTADSQAQRIADCKATPWTDFCAAGPLLVIAVRWRASGNSGRTKTENVAKEVKRNKANGCK